MPSLSCSFFDLQEELQQRTSTELRDFAVALDKKISCSEGETQDGQQNYFQLPQQNGGGIFSYIYLPEN